MSNSEDKPALVWPKDVISQPGYIKLDDANHLICFLACPFEPKEKADDLYDFIQMVCNEIGSKIGARIEVVRSDKLLTPGVIHTDIWYYIAQADALIFDVTGQNGNVLLELGVAAACRSTQNIIILKDSEDTSKYLFDIQPVRHLLYSRGLFLGQTKFYRELFEYLNFALTPTPFRVEEAKDSISDYIFSKEKSFDTKDLLSPPECHRALLEDGLEFGSLWNFRPSWITIGDSDYRDVEIKVTLKFSELRPSTDPSKTWVGIALRSQHFFVDYSNLVYIKGNGEGYYT